jgi:flavin reductase (DIM6/NTAB) family NADH-FMN oxidoreductase RutF
MVRVDPAERPYAEVYKLLIGAILPRPIAFVSTLSRDGCRNLAPFSFFNGVCPRPPTVMFAPTRRFSDGGEKDTLRNIRETKQFVINVVSEDFTEAMVKTAAEYPYGVDEFAQAGFTPLASEKVAPPRVAESKIHLECELSHLIEIGDGTAGGGFVVLGTVLLFHLHESVYDRGHVVLDALKPVGRLAGNWYCGVREPFEIARKRKPGD